MTIKVMHKTDRSIPATIYENVEEVIDVFNENGVYCHQLCMKDGSTATFPAQDWALWQRTWTKMF